MRLVNLAARIRHEAADDGEIGRIILWMDVGDVERDVEMFVGLSLEMLKNELLSDADDHAVARFRWRFLVI